MATLANNVIGAYETGLAGRREDERRNAMTKFLPGALKGNQGDVDQLVKADPDLGMRAMAHFQAMDAQQLAKKRDQQKEIASLAVAATTPEAWAQVNARAKQLNPNAPDIPFTARAMVIAQAQTVGEQLEQAWKEKTFGLQRDQFGLQQRQFAETVRSNKATEAARADAAAATRQFGPKLSPRDEAELKTTREKADVAAQSAAKLRSILPQLNAAAEHMGPGFGARRTAAGVLSVIPGVTWFEKQFSPDGTSTTENTINNFDAIEAASKDLGILKLGEIGGSDTERELLTAIQTTVSPLKEAKENARIYRNQLAAAEIVAQKADLQAKWANNFGGLNRLSQDGQTWQGFWSKYQKAAWNDFHDKPETGGPTTGPRNSPSARVAGRDVPPPPPGSEILE